MASKKAVNFSPPSTTILCKLTFIVRCFALSPQERDEEALLFLLFYLFLFFLPRPHTAHGSFLCWEELGRLDAW